MSKEKRRWLLASAALFAAVGVVYFFMARKESSTSAGPSGGCLIFQNRDSSKPCFLSGFPGPSVFPAPDGSFSGNVEDSTLRPSEESLAEALALCGSAISIERDDCVKAVAIQRKDASVCSAVRDLFNRNDCEKVAKSGPEITRDIFSRTIKDYDFSDFSPTSGASSSPLAFGKPLDGLFSDILSSVAERAAYARENLDSRFTSEGFFERIRSSPVTLFSFSRLQAAPGNELIATGFGFEVAGNDIHIGGYTVSGVTSSDTMTLRFMLPGDIQKGTHEVWVTNARGSSRRTDTPISITITDSPVSPPIITGVTPAVPALPDTVTLYGSNFGGAYSVNTSLGIIKNASASDSSVTFKISDFEVVDKIKDLPGIKGSLIPVSVIIASPQGYNQEPFTFNVQF